MAPDWLGRFSGGAVNQLGKLPDALAKGVVFVHVLLQESFQARPHGDGLVEHRVAAGGIGADVDEVYTFTWLHYAVASVRVDF